MQRKSTYKTMTQSAYTLLFHISNARWHRKSLDVQHMRLPRRSTLTKHTFSLCPTKPRNASNLRDAAINEIVENPNLDVDSNLDLVSNDTIKHA